MSTRVGVVGVGALGTAVAVNLLQAGFPVLGFRRSAMPDAFLSAGGEVAESAEAVAAESDVVLTILPAGDAFTEVLNGPRGLLRGAHPGLVVVEMSTLTIETKELGRQALAEAGASMVDCPVSGTPPQIVDRSAVLFLSGDPPDVERSRVVLESVTSPDRVVDVGQFCAGTKLKYVAYVMLLAHSLAAAEALALAKRSGLDLEIVVRTLTGSINTSMVFDRRAESAIRGGPPVPPEATTSFRLSLDSVDAFARQVGATTPLFDEAVRQCDALIAYGWQTDMIESFLGMLSQDATPGAEAATTG